MQTYSSSKKTRKLLKPFVKDPSMLHRLQHFINNQNVDPSVGNLEDTEESVQHNKRRQKPWKRNSSQQVIIDCISSDSEVSDSFDDDKLKSENFANISMRNVYLKINNSPQSPLLLPESASLTYSSTPTTTATGKRTTRFNNTPNCTEFDLKRRISSALTSEKKKQKSDENAKRYISANATKSTIPIHPKQKFSDIGGLGDKVKNIEDFSLYLKYPEDFSTRILPCGVLIHGPPGCGKTMVAHAVAGELELPLIEVASTELISGISGESEKNMRELFESAVNISPCVLFIDEIDALITKKDNAQKEMEKRIVSQLISCMDELSKAENPAKVLVLAATCSPHSLDPAVRRAGRFDEEIDIGIPDENTRIEILKILCKDLRFDADFDLHWLARNTPGYVGAELTALIKLADRISVRRFHKMSSDDSKEASEDLKETSDLQLPSNSTPTIVKEEGSRRKSFIGFSDFEEALRHYVPAAKKEGFAIVPTVTWNDVGALKDIREELQEAILWPIKYKDKFQKFKIPRATGILLCGPKGCGKTLLAKAIANECSINFLSVKGPELLSMYVGESERAVRECFQKAKNASPCVIFFDEIDALCPARSSSNDNTASDRVVAQLLTEMDGIEGRKEIFAIGATNRPDTIDSAMLRPGRFGKVIYVGIPSSIDRCDILQSLVHNGPKLADDVSLETLSQDNRCSRFSGADLSNLVIEASMAALRDSIKSTSEKEEGKLQRTHFEQALNKVKSSVSKRDVHIFKRMKYTNGKKAVPKRKKCAVPLQ